MLSLFTFAVFVVLQSPIQQGELPPPIVAGLKALGAGQCEDAFTMWSKDWTSPDDAGKQEQLRAGCNTLSRLGRLQGYDVLRTVDVGPHIRRVYLVLRYDFQPVYMMLVAYQPAEAWKTITVNWNTIADKVLPNTVVPTERPQP